MLKGRKRKLKKERYEGQKFLVTSKQIRNIKLALMSDKKMDTIREEISTDKPKVVGKREIRL